MLTPRRGDVRVEFKVKNRILWDEIHKTHASISAFSRDYDLVPSEVGKYLGLQKSPWMWKRIARTARDTEMFLALRRTPSVICQALGIGADALFPLHLYPEPGQKRVGVMAGTFEVDALSTLTLPAPVDPERLAGNAELATACTTALATLTPREALVLRLRNGFEGDALDLGSIGEQMGVSRERVRQIETKALRKLRHPSRSRALKEFVSLLDPPKNSLDT